MNVNKSNRKQERKAAKAVARARSSTQKKAEPPSYSDSVNQGALASNPYLQSVLDPFNVHGCKIPDLIMFPSVPFTVVDRRTLTVNANGVAFVTYGSGGVLSAVGPATLVPVPNNDVSGNTYAVGMVNGTGASTSSLFPSVNPGTYIEFSQWDSTSAAIPSAFQRARLVSAGLAINFTGTALNSKGKLTLAFAPRNSLRSEIGAGAVTIDRISKIPGAKVIPINELKGGTVLYKPLDNISLDYVNIVDFTYDVGSSANFATNLALAAASGGELYAIADGCTAGDSLQVTAVFNYEAIPKLSTFNLANATPSPSDPIALSHAVNVLQTTPTTIGDTSHMEGLKRGDKEIKMPTIDLSHVKTMTPHAGQQKSSMLDKVLNFISKVEGGIGKAINVVSKAAPLASTIMSML